jgi:hypothetical protein
MAMIHTTADIGIQYEAAHLLAKDVPLFSYTEPG